MTSEWSNQPTNKHRRQGGGKFRPVTPATRDQQLFIPPLTVLNIFSSIKIVWISSSALVNVLYSTLQDRIWCDRVKRILRERKSTPSSSLFLFSFFPPFFLVQRIGGYWTGRTERKFRSVDGGNILLDTLASEAKQQQQQKLDIYIYLPPIDGHKKTSLLFLLCLSLFVPLFFCSKFFFFFYFLRPSHRGATYLIVPSSPHPNYGPSTTRPSFSQFVDDYDDNDNFLGTGDKKWEIKSLISAAALPGRPLNQGPFESEVVFVTVRRRVKSSRVVE